MIAIGVLGARVVRGHDCDVGAIHSDLPHQRPLASITVSAGAEDDDHPSFSEPPGSAEYRVERIRSVRVVDDHRE